MALRWGVLSAGKISNDFVSAVNLLPKTEHKFVAVAEQQLVLAQEFAKLHSIPRAYGNFAQLATDPEIEVVYIGIINPYHAAMVKLMLEAGKHVLCEKPMTLNYKLTKELIDLAKSRNLFLMEGIWTRFLPSYQYVTDQIKKGVIGKVYYVNVNIGSNLLNCDRVTRKELGGGTVVDMGVYCIDIIEQVFNNEKPERIKAVGHLNESGVDVDVSAVLQFSGNRTATMTAQGHVQLPREAHIVGTKGTIKICSVAASMDGVYKVYVNDVLHEFNLKTSKLDLYYQGSYGLGYEANAVRKCIRAGRIECDLMSHKDSLLFAKIEDELRRQLGVVYDCDD